MSTMKTWMPTMLLGLLLPAAAPFLSRAPAGADDPAAAVQPALDVEAVLAAARAAANREAWSAAPEGLVFTGTTDIGGIDADFELHLTVDGRYRFELDGPLGRTLAFDGHELARRLGAGPVQLLELGDRESWNLGQWVHSGYWLEESCPLAIEWESESEDSVTLALSFPDSAAASRLVLDRETWLPRELRSPSMGAESVTEFQLYKPVAGVPIARAVLNRAHGVDTALYVLEGEIAGADAGDRYATDRAFGEDVHFDEQIAPGVELERVRSGHLLVHPLVDGQDVGWFILDSGAGQICIDPAVADELGLDSIGSLPAVGISGVVQSSFRPGTSLQLGPMRMDDPVFVEIDLSFLGPLFGVEIAGICGYDVFARAVLELDLEAVSLSFHDPSRYELAEGEWARLHLDGGTPCVEGRFEGDRSGLFKLDLGDPGTITFYSPAVESLGLLEGREVRPSMVGGVGGMGKASEGRLDWFEIGGNRVEQLPAKFSQTGVGVFSSTVALGNLGSAMLEPFRIVFDYHHARIALVPRE